MDSLETGWFYLGLENGWTLCTFNVKFGEIIYSGDPINILPSLCKYESFQMMISLAELQICCCCLFLDLKVCLEESRRWVTMKTLGFLFFPQKRKANLLLCRCRTFHSLSYSTECSLSYWKFGAARELMIPYFPLYPLKEGNDSRTRHKALPSVGIRKNQFNF